MVCQWPCGRRLHCRVSPYWVGLTLPSAGVLNSFLLKIIVESSRRGLADSLVSLTLEFKSYSCLHPTISPLLELLWIEFLLLATPRALTNTASHGLAPSSLLLHFLTALPQVASCHTVCVSPCGCASLPLSPSSALLGLFHFSSSG